jgi:hypothetical protein
MADDHEEVRLETNQLGGEVGHALELALCPAGLTGHSLTLAIAEVAQGLQEAPGRPGYSLQQTDAWDLRTRLCVRGGRRHEEAQGEDDEEHNQAGPHAESPPSGVPFHESSSSSALASCRSAVSSPSVNQP